MNSTRTWLPWGALAFLVAAILIVIGFAIARPSWFDGDAAPGEREYAKSLLDVGEEDGVRLSDDNTTSRSFSLPVPVDSRIENPVLRLRGQTQVAESSTVFLRVLVDGQALYVDELRRGDHKLSADIDLPDSAVEKGVVNVQVKTDGSLDQRRCNITEDLGALVFLDPERTQVRAGLDERVHTVRDVVAGLDHEVRLVLSDSAEGEEWFATAAELAAFLTQQGHDVTYSSEPGDGDSQILVGTADGLDGVDWESDDEGSVRVARRDGQPVLAVVEPAADVVPTFVTTSPVTTADSESSTPEREEVEQASGTSINLERLGADTSVQQISDRRTWQIDYALPDLPGGTVPTALRLQMMIPATTVDARWIVEVRLNDDLVATQRLGGIGRQNVAVPLPAGRELVRNDLAVTLIRDRDLGGCNVRRTSYDVQLLPGSTLTVGGDGAGFTAVPADFSGGFDVVLDSSRLDDPTRTLAALVPTLAEFSRWREAARFAWDGAPAQRPFLLLGEPERALAPVVTVADGRIEAAGLDLSAFKDGYVVQPVTSGATPGLALTPVGEPDDQVPPYGRERARVVATGGGGFVVTPQGRVETVPAARVGIED
ncbi:hypothetical protein [Aeromicrobium duanguangcaii]|uniref:hypothetical protein n=1 Tax=Aeromicrobium duanguangcaii TaxID=2968086 RepID=UPI0020173F75|nr:hypothetical protein [Aeromicrobium duanguangcaii]MCL3837113.1 hypothetical protein [Aeromicrobium duanguangcaii]